MLIYYSEIDLAAGFEVLDQPKRSRLVRGMNVSAPSGLALFSHLHKSGQPLKCWHCGVEASSWIVNRGQNDNIPKPPVLDLFARVNNVPVLMTRDHIIPKSWGGVNDNENLRVGCSTCNHARGNHIDEADQAFMDAHPELIHRGPDWKAPVMQNDIKAAKPEPTPEEIEAKRQKKLAANRKRRARHRARVKAKRKANEKVQVQPE